jgi:hypothetical protein
VSLHEEIFRQVIEEAVEIFGFCITEVIIELFGLAGLSCLSSAR